MFDQQLLDNSSKLLNGFNCLESRNNKKCRALGNTQTVAESRKWRQRRRKCSISKQSVLLKVPGTHSSSLGQPLRWVCLINNSWSIQIIRKITHQFSAVCQLRMHRPLQRQTCAQTCLPVKKRGPRYTTKSHSQQHRQHRSAVRPSLRWMDKQQPRGSRFKPKLAQSKGQPSKTPMMQCTWMFFES